MNFSGVLNKSIPRSLHILHWNFPDPWIFNVPCFWDICTKVLNKLLEFTLSRSDQISLGWLRLLPLRNPPTQVLLEPEPPGHEKQRKRLQPAGTNKILIAWTMLLLPFLVSTCSWLVCRDSDQVWYFGGGRESPFDFLMGKSEKPGSCHYLITWTFNPCTW